MLHQLWDRLAGLTRRQPPKQYRVSWSGTDGCIISTTRGTYNEAIDLAFGLSVANVPNVKVEEVTP